jgi:hypothetical protein
MKSSSSFKFVVATVLAVAALGASTAHARSDVYFSVGVQGAPVYVEPAPIYVQPRPVYVQPRPVYVQPPVYTAPVEVYVRPNQPVYDYSYEDERAWRRAEWRRRHWRHHHEDWEQSQSRNRYWD